MEKVDFLGTGSFLPPKVMSNKDIEAVVDTTDEWIRTRTGICERRIAEAGVTSSHLGTRAAKLALDDAGIIPADIDMIIVATSTPDMFFPSTACLIQGNLGASNAFAFDISAACTGFVYAINVAEQFIRSGRCRYCLIIGSEVMSRIVDWTDRNTCILFGDGAGAVVLGRAVNGGNGILASSISADGRGCDLIEVPGGGSRHPISEKCLNDRLNFIRMKGNETFKVAVKKMSASIQEVMQMAGMPLSEISYLVPHQANSRILKAVGEKLGISAGRIVMNMDRYGNTSAASIPIALDEIARSGRLDSGDNLLISAFGSGLTWGSVLFQWTR